MNSLLIDNYKPELDLHFERNVDVPPEKIWLAWTTPGLLMQWFCPLPWRTVACEIDLKPGGKFNTTMRSPEGQEFPNSGCYLEIVPNQRLVWTNVFLPGFRPANFLESNDSCGSFPFTGIISLTPQSQGTHYQAVVLHADKAGRNQHAAMGFEVGWGAAFDQMIAMIKGN